MILLLRNAGAGKRRVWGLDAFAWRVARMHFAASRANCTTVDGFVHHPSPRFPFRLLEEATWGEIKVSFPNPQVQRGMSTA